MSNATKTSNKAGLHCELTQLALATGLCLASASAFAQETATLSTVTVKESSVPSVKVDEAISSKFTAPLLDVPMTVEVINETILQQTGATSLQEALRTVPGITFGNGEGGNPNGDQPFIRGSDAQGSTFIDGMRDIAAGSREVFNLEAIEVVKGADSTYAGRGGVGGSINLSTKKAKNDNFVNGDVGLGTDSYKRATLDLNRKLNDTTGFRLNAMAHDADVPGRTGPENKRWGIAPTVTLGMGTPTEVTLSWQHLKTDNIPDGGVPYLFGNGNTSVTPKTASAAAQPGGSVIRPTFGSNRENWYGLKDRDHEKETSDLFTASIEHKFTATNKLRNTFRYSKTKQDSIWTQPDDSKGNVLNNYVNRRMNARIADVKTFQNATELTGKEILGNITHTYAVGMELSKERSDARTAVSNGPATADANCSAVTLWCASLNSPNIYTPWTGSIAYGNTVINKMDTVALYGFDSIQLSEKWLLNAGLRLDHYEGFYQTGSTITKSNDNLLNYSLGVVYKPAANGSIYANLGTSSRPGGSSLGNGNEDLTITSSYLADLSPEKTRSIEFGTKWDLLDKKLGLTAAIFRNETTNIRTYDSTGTGSMSAKKIVNGLELGATGQITAQWSIFAGYTLMDSIQKGLNRSGRNNTVDAGNNQAAPNTPRHSASIWTHYKPTQKLGLGLGVYAQSDVTASYVLSTNTANPGIVKKGVSGYARYDAMASYQFTPNVALQVNVYNLTDKVYYSGVRSPHYANIAPGRSAVATLKFTY